MDPGMMYPCMPLHIGARREDGRGSHTHTHIIEEDDEEGEGGCGMGRRQEDNAKTTANLIGHARTRRSRCFTSGISLAPRKKLTFRVKARVSACAPATGMVVAEVLLQGSTCGSSTMAQVRKREGGREGGV